MNGRSRLQHDDIAMVGLSLRTEKVGSIGTRSDCAWTQARTLVTAAWVGGCEHSSSSMTAKKWSNRRPRTHSNWQYAPPGWRYSVLMYQNASDTCAWISLAQASPASHASCSSRAALPTHAYQVHASNTVAYAIQHTARQRLKASARAVKDRATGWYRTIKGQQTAHGCPAGQSD